MLDVIFVGNFPQPPLNHSREKEWPPLKIIIAYPLGKLWMLPKLSSQNMRGFDHATILSPSFHGLCKERLPQWPAFCVLNSTKNSGKVLPEKLWGGVRHASWNPYPFSDQNLWFSLLYFRPDQKFDTLSQTWSPGAQNVTGVREKLLRHIHSSWRKH